MKERDKKRLQINTRDLVHNLDVSEVQDYLYEKEVLTLENLELLQAEKYPQKAARYLVVSMLPRKGNQAFKIFCEALREANYEYLAEQLENTKLVSDPPAECRDNKCADEKNELRKKSVSLEAQLKQIRQVEVPPLNLTEQADYAESHTSEDISDQYDSDHQHSNNPKRRSNTQQNYLEDQKKTASSTKTRLRALERENFQLKKQLSFYEEPSATKATAAVKRNEFEQAGAAAVTPRITGRDSPDSEEVFHSTVNTSRSSYDVSDIHLHVPNERTHLKQSSFQFYDLTDGAIKTTPKDCNHRNNSYDDVDENQADDFTPVMSYSDETLHHHDESCDISSEIRKQGSRIQYTPSFSRQEQYTDEETLIEVLTSDTVNCMYHGTERNIHLLNPHYSDYVITLRKAIKTTSKKYRAIFEQISGQVELNATWREINEQMGSLFSKLLVDDFHQHSLTWGRILALFTLTGFVAKRCASIHKVALPLGDFLANYIEKKLKRKIRKLGGWESFCKLMEKEELTISCVIPTEVLHSTVLTSTVAKTSSRPAEKRRTKSLGKGVATNKLLDKREHFTSFKKTW